VKSTVLSGGEFNQFGSAIAWPLSRDVRRTPEWNAARMLAAVDALARSESGLVVVHLPYTDHVAHSDRVGAPRYRRQFRWADSLIPKFREKLPAGAVMVVLGDHGHTLDGRHGSGLVTPTTAVYVGGPFRRGVDLGLINLASNRYLLNGAFGLPVPAGGYTGGVYPEAFVNAEKTGRSPEDAAELSAPVPQLTMKSSALFVWLSFGVMVAIWLNLALAEWSPLRFRAWHHGLTLLGLAAAWLPLLWAGPVALGAGLTVLILADHAGTNWRRRLVWTAGLVAAAWALHGWGRLLGGMIDAQQALSLPWLATVWFVIGTVGAVAALRFDRTRLIWVGLAVPGLLRMRGHQQ
jgi:hypothetical protein